MGVPALRLAPNAIVCITLIAVAITVFEPITSAAFLVPLSYNEGWNAYHAARAMGDGLIYPPPDALVSNNYPPISFYAIGAISRILNVDPIIAGRLTAMIALVTVAANISLIVRRFHARWISALFAAVFFVGLVNALARNYVATNNPDWLAYAVMTSGAVVFLYGRSHHAGVVAAAAIMVFAGLIKHHLLPIPVAVTIWCWQYDRPAFRVWITAIAAFTIGAVGFLYLNFGDNALHGILLTPRQYALSHLVKKSYKLFWLVAPLIAIAGILWRRSRTDPELKLIYFHAIVAALWGMFISGGDGVSYNAFFDFVIALAVISGVAGDRLIEPRQSNDALPPLVRTLTLLVMAALIFANVKTVKTLTLIPQLRERERLTHEDIRFVAGQEGKAICENLALCFWAGKPFEIDFFNVGQKLKSGVLEENDFIMRLRQHEFSVIQVQSSSRLTPNVNKAIYQYYEIAKRSPILGDILTSRRNR